MKIRLGIVGVGQIARDQHLPVIAGNPDFELVAAASRNATVDGVKNFRSLSEMLAAVPDLQAVSLCTPPVGRSDDAIRALTRGVHTMLEKPPAATLGEAHALIDVAAASGATLFATWHSRHAAAIPAARAWLQGKAVRSVRIAWLEDMRVWHPGQEWILEAGGLGVFDPGINALSILTHLLPEAFSLRTAALTFPGNRQAPVRATLEFRTPTSVPITAEFDFLHEGTQQWDLNVETDGGILTLKEGGGRLFIDGMEPAPSAARPPLSGEYAALYQRFAGLVRSRSSDHDVTPLRHVADAFLLGTRHIGPDFHF